MINLSLTIHQRPKIHSGSTQITEIPLRAEGLSLLETLQLNAFTSAIQNTRHKQRDRANCTYSSTKAGWKHLVCEITCIAVVGLCVIQTY